ncbi:MAG: DUF4365 domain-containing protein [Syntrophobacteraceae bacterium]
MKRPSAHITGDLAEFQVAAVLQARGCAVSKLGADYGEDLSVEIPVDGDLTGARILIQVKGTRVGARPRAKAIQLARISTNVLKKWSRTVSPVALVQWNIVDQTGHFLFMNSAHSYCCDFKQTAKSKTIYGAQSDLISSTNCDLFITNALLAHRLQSELIHGVSDFDDCRQELSEEIVSNSVGILETIGLLENRDGGFILSESGKEAFVEMLDDIHTSQPDWYAEDVVRRAIVYTLRRSLRAEPISEPRLLTNLLKVACYFLAAPQFERLMAEWGHPVSGKDGVNNR